MVEEKKGVLHGVDVVESVGEIDSNFYDLTTSNIVGNNSVVENILVDTKTCGSSILCNEVKELLINFFIEFNLIFMNSL
jgi:hypothetical protein